MADVCSRQTGVELNFEGGKTECVCFFHGKGSKEDKRTEQPTLHVSLASRRQVKVRIVRQYTHLGSILHFSTSCLPDVQHKSRAADATFARLCSTLLHNAELSVKEKKQLVLGLAHAKIDSGSGLWTPRTQTETNAMNHACMKHWRGACRPILGVSSKFLDDAAVCSMLIVLPPDTVLQIARVRQLKVLSEHPDSFPREVVTEARDWLELTFADFGEVLCTVLPCPLLDLGNCWASIRPSAHKIPNPLRAYKRHVLGVLAEDSEFHLTRCRTLWKFEQAGGVQLKIRNFHMFANRAGRDMRGKLD